MFQQCFQQLEVQRLVVDLLVLVGMQQHPANGPSSISFGGLHLQSPASIFGPAQLSSRPEAIPVGEDSDSEKERKKRDDDTNPFRRSVKWMPAMRFLTSSVETSLFYPICP